jgi:hypothetical protein
MYTGSKWILGLGLLCFCGAAAAQITYNVDLVINSFPNENEHIQGTITTDGQITKPLLATDITSWSLYSISGPTQFAMTGGAGSVTISPAGSGPLIATASNLTYNFTQNASILFQSSGAAVALQEIPTTNGADSFVVITVPNQSVQYDVLPAPTVIATANATVAAPKKPIWNLAEDFSINNNPNNQWSYGSTPTLGGAFAAFTVTSTITFQVRHGAVAEWNGTYLQGGELFPIVSKYYGDPGTIVTVFSGTKDDPGINLIQRSANGVVMHPTLPGLGYGISRWTAPQSGTYVIKVSFFSADINLGATTDVHVQRNHVSLFDGDVKGIGSAQHWFSGTAGIALNAGDVIDFAVGPNGDLTSDSTGVDAAIQQLPEVLSCTEDGSVYKAVKPSNSVSSAVSPNISGTPVLCAIPSAKPANWYIKTSWDGGNTWQWEDTLDSLGLGQI